MTFYNTVYSYFYKITNINHLKTKFDISSKIYQNLIQDGY